MKKRSKYEGSTLAMLVIEVSVIEDYYLAKTFPMQVESIRAGSMFPALRAPSAARTC
jgi:hypothetical protein